MGRSVEFDVSEYTLVFRRVLDRESRPGHASCAPDRQDRRDGGTRHADDNTGAGWHSIRPGPDVLVRRQALPDEPDEAAIKGPECGIAEVFIVPLCSTLALDDLAYERFLRQSGVLDDALDLLGAMTLAEADSVETIRKEIQSLVMAAEVQYIVDGMSA